MNLKGEEKSTFVLNYIKKCKENGLPYELKFSREDSRNDQIVILSSLEDFKKNTLLVEELTKNMSLGDLPMLIGEYKNKIGIGEEYYNRLYSFTKARLVLVRTSVKKYICDHKDEFYNQVSDDDKRKIEKYISRFKELYENEMEEKQELGKDYEDLKKRDYQIKSSIDCAKEHIENDRDAYVYRTDLLDLNRAIQKLYSNSPEKFIKETTQNFRTIGTEVWGFSKDIVFSNETEERFLTNKDILSATQINSELEEISRNGLVRETQTYLINISREKESQIDGLEQQ